MTAFAIDAYKKIVRAERRVVKLNKELRGHLGRLTPEQLRVYEETTRLWEHKQG